MLCDDLGMCVLFEVVCLKASNQSSEWNTQFLKPCASAPWHPPTTVVGMLVNNSSTSITCQDSSCMFYQISFLLYHLLYNICHLSFIIIKTSSQTPSFTSIQVNIEATVTPPCFFNSTCTRPFSIVPKPTPSRRYKKMPTWLTQVQVKPQEVGFLVVSFFGQEVTQICGQWVSWYLRISVRNLTNGPPK